MRKRIKPKLIVYSWYLKYSDRLCPICGMGLTSIISFDEEFEYKGKLILVHEYVTYKCDTCGEEIVDERSLKKAASALRNLKCQG